MSLGRGQPRGQRRGCLGPRAARHGGSPWSCARATASTPAARRFRLGCLLLGHEPLRASGPRANGAFAPGCAASPGLGRGGCAGRPDGGSAPRLAGSCLVPPKAQQGLWRSGLLTARWPDMGARGKPAWEGTCTEATPGREGRRLSCRSSGSFWKSRWREESFRDQWFPSRGTRPLSHPFFYWNGPGLCESRGRVLRRGAGTQGVMTL